MVLKSLGIFLKCRRCTKTFDDDELRQGLMEVIVINSEESRLCLKCVRLTLTEWVVRTDEIAELGGAYGKEAYK